MLTIALIAQKGGTGKTTLARCLAVAFERRGQAAAIIDMDPQASAALWAGRRKADTPEVITTPLPLLGKTLTASAKVVEVAIIDTPPKTEAAAIAAARAADLVLIPCRAQIDDIDTLPATKQLLDAAGGVEALVFLNALPPYQARRAEAVAAIETNPTAPFRVAPGGFGQRAAFGDASLSGLSPEEYQRTGKAAQEIGVLYKLICKIVNKSKSITNDKKTQHRRRR